MNLTEKTALSMIFCLLSSSMNEGGPEFEGGSNPTIINIHILQLNVNKDDQF